jgi:hypothetical protein
MICYGRGGKHDSMWRRQISEPMPPNFFHIERLSKRFKRLQTLRKR